jgi:DNA-3-methyladenine glycosylase I
MPVVSEVARCSWARTPASIAYHDAEWGVPVHDDRKLFELLTLEGAQAGLSWETILAKRARYREAFERFDIARVAKFGEREVDRLLADPGIVRNRAKIRATIGNARALLALREAEGTDFADYLWAYVGGKPLVNRPATPDDVPAQTPLAAELSRDLRARGFKFVGPTIVYAFMQAVGLIDDHLVSCFRSVPPAGVRRKPHTV